jgi:competence ComEA-like helix-hairpin-helix protein
MTRVVKAALVSAILTAAFLAPGSAWAGLQPPPRTALPVEGVVNVNSASADEFALLPGIGPGKAKAIVTYRSAHGNFKAVDDLTSVKGIGTKTLARIREHLTLTGPTTIQRIHPPGPTTPPGAPNAALSP